jgi:hypothetical protein
MFSICARAHAFYHIDKAQSIYYEGDDLRMKLLFGRLENCQNFLNILYDTQKFYEGVEIICTETFEPIRLHDYPKCILASHYVTDDYDSSEVSSCISDDDSASLCSLSSPTAYLIMIEDPNSYHIFGLKVFDCHLMSIAKYPEEKSNPNNILRLGWTLHQHFDGFDGIGGRVVPRIAIGFVSADKEPEHIEVSHGYTELKYRVTLSIEAPDPRILHAVGDLLKAGSMSSPDKDGKLYSSVSVDSAEDFQRCLTVRYNETKRLWQRYRAGDPLPATESRKRKSCLAASNLPTHS